MPNPGKRAMGWQKKRKAGTKQRQQAERRSEEVVRMAQEYYFPWRPEW